jgi:hypothetical protein
VYQNPVENTIFINAQEKIDKVSIYSIIGKEVKKFDINTNKAEINTSDLKSGIYILKYVINDSVGTKKFIKR